MSNEKYDPQNERQKLVEIQHAFENAVKNNAIDDMRKYVHEQFSFVSFTNSASSDFNAFSKQWKITRERMLGLSGSFVTNLNPQPTIFIDDVAVCTGNADNVMIDNRGKKFDFSTHWTVVFKRENDAWKVLRAHSSTDPFANPILVDHVKQRIVKYGIMSFAAGVTLGYFLLSII